MEMSSIGGYRRSEHKIIPFAANAARPLNLSVNIRIWPSSSAVRILSPSYHTDNERNGQFQACRELPFCSVVAVAVVHVPITNENVREHEFN